jgi:hypothetical protein
VTKQFKKGCHSSDKPEMKNINLKNTLILTLFVFSVSGFSQTCQTDPAVTLLELPKFDANYAGCYNYYAVDLGIEAANKKCKILSKVQNFSEPSFSACNDLLQPSRAEWKAAIADECMDLSKKINFHTKSFKSCVEYFSISTAGKYSPEKKQKIVNATHQCIGMNSNIDFASKSFTSCFSLYGGNLYPLGKTGADQSIVIAAECTDKVKSYDYSNRKLYDCWDKNRTLNKDRKLMVDTCVAENPDSK